MEKNYTNYGSLARDVLSGIWLLHDARSMRHIAQDFINKIEIKSKIEKQPAYIKCVSGESFAVGEEPEDKKGLVMVIPVHGVLTKYDNCIGCATKYVADALLRYAQDENICAFVLDIDSPGGSVNAIMPLVNAINKVRETGKPVICHCDQCCSAAYWIASQTDGIFADNLMSVFGSIGAYVSLIDDRENLQTGEKVIDVYAPESVDKNREYREALDGETKLLEQKLSECVAHFIDAVKAGREGLLDEKADGLFTGATFETTQAIEIGLVNSQADLDDCVNIAYVRANY